MKPPRKHVLMGIAIGLTLGLALQLGARAAQQPQPQRERGGGFTEPTPMDFNDHAGYVSLFDGVSLKGWDGNPKFWRVENGAIVGESTPTNPSGNSYIAYRNLEAKDFTLKFEIKIEGDGGSGIQYRSKTGLPWLRPIPANVKANVGPVNLNWMMTGRRRISGRAACTRGSSIPRTRRCAFWRGGARSSKGSATRARS
jgi:hypothetical protein